MSARDFKSAVKDAFKSLPEKLKEKLRNISVIVRDNPTPAEVRETELDEENDSLYGLYEGDARPGRGGEGLFPDRIIIYRVPLLQDCKNRKELLKEIRLTVIHEVGHYFGLTDEELP
jgi:predicted Zn-dependent protease with MMP-like domain